MVELGLADDLDQARRLVMAGRVLADGQLISQPSQSILQESELELLKYGRHFRLDGHTKIVVGRTKADNQKIGQYSDPKKDTTLKVTRFPGPLVVMPGVGTEAMVMLAAAIGAGYSKAPPDQPVELRVSAQAKPYTVTVLPVAPKTVSKFLI